MIIPAPPKGFVLEDEEPSSYMGQDYAEARSALPRRDTAHAGGNVPPPPAGFVLEDEQREPTRDVRFKLPQGFIGEEKAPWLMRTIAGGEDEAQAIMKSNLFRRNPEIAQQYQSDPGMQYLMDNPADSFIPSIFNLKLGQERIGEVNTLSQMTRDERKKHFSAKGKVKTAELFGDKKDLREYMLFSGVLGDMKSREFKESLERLQKNDYPQSAIYKGAVSPDKMRDQLVVRDKLLRLEEIQERGQNIPSEILDSIANMGKYAGEIYLMGGLMGGPAPATQLGKLGLGATMGAMNVGELSKLVTERTTDKGYLGDKGEFIQTEKGQSLAMALPKSLVEQTATYWTEQQGEVIGKYLNKIGGAVLSKLPKGLASQIKTVLKKSRKLTGPLYEKLRKAKVDTMAPELVEEYIDRVIKPVLMLDDQYRDKDDEYLTRVAKSLVPDPKEVLIQAATFSLLPVAGHVAGALGYKGEGPEPGRKTPYEPEPGQKEVIPPISEAVDTSGLPPVSTQKPPQAPVTQEVTPKKPDTLTPVEALKPVTPAQTQPKEQIVSPVSVEPPPVVSVEKQTGRVQTEGEAETDPARYRAELEKKYGQEKWDEVFFELAEGGENERFNELDAETQKLDEAGKFDSPEAKKLRMEYEQIVGVELEKRYPVVSGQTQAEATVTPEGKQPWEYQDANQEQVVHGKTELGQWDKGNSYRHVIEGSGDIFRESTKSIPDGGYIGEKIRRIKRQMEKETSGKIHPEDTFTYSRENNQAKYDKLIEQWENQPTENKSQELAKELNLKLLKGDFDVEGLISQIESEVEKSALKVEVVPKGTIAKKQAGKVEQPKTWWEFANKVSEAFYKTKAAKLEKESPLRTSRATKKEIAEILGVSIADVERGFAIYNDANPQDLINDMVKGKPVPTLAKPTPAEAKVKGEVKQIHDYSNTQIQLPPKQASKIVNYGKKIPDAIIYTDPKDSSYGRETEPHITVRYGLDVDNKTELQKAFEGFGPIEATMGEISIFETDDYDVIKVDIDSQKLRDANKKVGDVVSLPGETHKKYMPHITIAYVKKGEGKKYIGDKTFEGEKIFVSNIVLKTRNDESLVIELTSPTGPITKAEKDALQEKGYKVSDILKMSPEQARAKLLRQEVPAPIQKKTESTEKPPAKTTEGIEDFGEKIGGARKDYYAQLEKAKKYDIASSTLSQSFPEPNYQKLIDEGSDPYVVGVVRAMRDEIPSKPRRTYKLNRWVQQVELLRQFADDLLSGNIGKEVFNKKIESPDFKNLMGSIKGRAELYEIVGHKVSLKGVKFHKVKYSYYKGKPGPVEKWIIEVRAKATPFSNMPKVLASGDTREEAISKFIEQYESLNTEGTQRAEVKFDVYQYRNDPKTVWIGKKIGRNAIDLKSFESSKEARLYLKDNHDELVSLLKKAKYVPEERRAKNEKRIGPDHRKGKDVTPDMFMKGFGFKGVEFGNWVAKGGERQQSLNDAYDALMDLSLILNIPSQAISLNGELSLAFGSRGRGGKKAPAAHYEPNKVVINLTRKAGPGTLSHEWWHAIDNYFSRLRKKPMGYLSETPYGITDFSKVRKAMYEAFWAIDEAYKKTEIVKRSRNLDKLRSKPYWTQPKEITARMFENYVISSLAEKGYSNDYLSNIVTQYEYMRDLSEHLLESKATADDAFPYLTEDEKKIVIPAYKKFFETIETKQVPGKLYASVGASKSPQLDRALQRAEGKVSTTYVSQRSGKWLVSAKQPQYGDYYEISAGESKLVKGKTNFPVEAEAIKASQYIAKNTNQPVYVWQSEKGFELSPEKPKNDHVQINPKGPGLTKAERAILSKQQVAEAEIAQEEGQKVGFKVGRAEAIKDARNKFNELLIAQKLTDKHRQDAADVVRQYVPKEQQYRYIKRILEAKTNKRLDNISKAINLYLDRYEQRAAKRDFANFIKENKSKYRRGEVPFGKLRSDVRDKLMKVLEQYDTAKLSEAKKEKLESRDEYIRRIAGSVADAFESLEDMGLDILQMPNARIEVLDRLRKTHIGELDVDQIRYIHSSLDHLIKIAERKGDIKERIHAEKVGKLINTARQEVAVKSKEPGVSKEFTGILGIAPRILSTAQATPHTLTGYLSGKENAATMELINKNLVSMTRDKHSKAKDFTLSYIKMLKDAGIKQSDEKILDEKIKITYGGKTFDSNVDDLMGVYMDIRADGNMRRMMKSGRVFYSYKRHPKHLYIQSRTKIYTGRPKLKELRGVVDYVENQHPELKKMADVYFEHNFKVQTPVVNETSMAYQNYELARKGKYWHTQREMPIGVEGRKTNISVSVENQGRFLPITGGNHPFRNIPFRQGVISNIQANAAYASMTIPMQDIKALISDKKWQDTVIKNGLQKELSVLVTMLRRTQGMITSQDFIDVVGAKVLNGFGKYALSLRLSGYGVQTASIPAAFEVIEPKYFIAPRAIAKLPKIPIKAIREMMDLSPTLWMRWTARQFDYVIGGVAAQHAYDNLIWGDKALTEKFLNHYTWGDQKAIYQIYQAAQEKVAAETEFKRGSDEFKKRAIEITEDALETQPQWDIIYRNELTSSSNIVLRGSLMFSSARNAQYNVLLRAMDDYRKGRIGAGEAGKRVSGVVYANILVAIVKRLVKMGVKYGWLGLLFLLSEDDEEKEKITKAAKAEIAKEPSQVAVDSALNFISLPAFGSMFQNIAYETIKRIKYPNMQYDLKDVRTGNIFADLALDVTGIIADTGVMTKYLITGEKFESGPDEDKPKWKRSAWEVADQLAELIAIRTGLPYSAPKGEIYYQIKSAESAVKRAKSRKELLKIRWDNTFHEIGTTKGVIHYPGKPHKGKEQLIAEIDKLLEGEK